MSAKSQARRMSKPVSEQATLEVRKVLVQLIVTQVDPDTGETIHEGAVEAEQVFEKKFGQTFRDYVNAAMASKGVKARNLAVVPKEGKEG